MLTLKTPSSHGNNSHCGAKEVNIKVSIVLLLVNFLLQDNMEIHEAVELIAYLYYDGKIDQGSKFEIELCKAVTDQIKNNPDISHRTLALCWIYLHRQFGESFQLVVTDKNLWVFDQSHFKDAITLLLLHDRKERERNDLELKKLITSQFRSRVRRQVSPGSHPIPAFPSENCLPVPARFRIFE